MEIPQTNAWKYIGTVNPGFGYTWIIHADGSRFLYVPDTRQAQDVFWPVLVVTVLTGLWIVVIYQRWTRTKTGQMKTKP